MNQFMLKGRNDKIRAFIAPAISILFLCCGPHITLRSDLTGMLSPDVEAVTLADGQRGINHTGFVGLNFLDTAILYNGRGWEGDGKGPANTYWTIPEFEFGYRFQFAGEADNSFYLGGLYARKRARHLWKAEFGKIIPFSGKIGLYNLLGLSLQSLDYTTRYVKTDMEKGTGVYSVIKWRLGFYEKRFLGVYWYGGIEAEGGTLWKQGELEGRAVLRFFLPCGGISLGIQHKTGENTIWVSGWQLDVLANQYGIDTPFNHRWISQLVYKL